LILLLGGFLEDEDAAPSEVVRKPEKVGRIGVHVVAGTYPAIVIDRDKGTMGSPQRTTNGCALLNVVFGFSARKIGSQSFALLLWLVLQLPIVATRAAPQVPPQKNVLIINEAGLSHSLTALVTQQILEGMQDTRDLPPGSMVVFREQTFWEHASWVWTVSLIIILGLSALAAYLQKSRKQLEAAKESQRQLGGRLINAQEQERSRLAAELHDDFSQRIALLALELENAADAIPDSAKEASERLRALAGSVTEIAADLHTLSHRLHSSTLRNLGLTPGISALCREFSAQLGIAIDFSPESVPRDVPPDVALCLFRIVQEALRNIHKHSGATRAQVSLRMAGKTLILSVSDDGRGFTAAGDQYKNGLGIRNMEERARLVGGRFEIHSEPSKGTLVEASVPLEKARSAKA